MQKIGIFGGTFNPVHWGHLLLAETAWAQLNLERVIWIPSGSPPHKSEKSILPLVHRAEMVRLAIANHPAFTLELVPAQTEEPAYAIATLHFLQACYPQAHWYQIVGLDAFQSLPRWYCRTELIPACDWLVAPRLPLGKTELICQQVERSLAKQFIPIRWQILDMPFVDISSSLVRYYCAQNRSIRYLVPTAVRDYIIAHQLY
jgi:nicotinate-nucleotide adenylyltransferase